MDPETAGSCWTWTSAVLPCCHLLKEEGAMMSANTHTHTHILCTDTSCMFCLLFSSLPSLPVPLTHANAIYLHHLNGFLVTLCQTKRAFAWHHTHKHCNNKKNIASFFCGIGRDICWQNYWGKKTQKQSKKEKSEKTAVPWLFSFFLTLMFTSTSLIFLMINFIFFLKFIKSGAGDVLRSTQWTLRGLPIRAMINLSMFTVHHDDISSCKTVFFWNARRGICKLWG